MKHPILVAPLQPLEDRHHLGLPAGRLSDIRPRHLQQSIDQTFQPIGILRDIAEEASASPAGISGVLGAVQRRLNSR